MEQPLGHVTVHPSVLAIIARLTALATPGVARLGRSRQSGVGRVWARLGSWGGVDLGVCDDGIAVDLYVVAEAEVSLLRLGHDLQAEVRQAIHELVGTEVLQVNVHILDVDVPLASAI
jgi:uncharacterized alkaline shock family protein YloU